MSHSNQTGPCCGTVPFRQDGKHRERQQSMLWWIKWAVQVAVVVVTTVISLQMALTKFCKDAISDENKGWCSRSSSSIVPINIRWLVWFLSQQEETAYEGVSRLESLPGTKICVVAILGWNSFHLWTYSLFHCSWIA